MRTCGGCRSRFACRQGGCESAQRAEAESHGLREGEVYFPHWCQDVAIGCSCAPHVHQTIDYISIARGTDGPVMYDRCLGCGARWTSRDYRWEPAKRLRPFVVEVAA